MGALACALAVLPAGAGATGAAAPCWQKVQLDWAADGNVDERYPVVCYSQAIDHLSTTELAYSSAEDDILRAQQRAIADRNTTGSGSGALAPDTSGDDGGSSVPTPLIVLGAVALLLVAAGGVGYMRRRGSDTAS